MDEWHTLVAFLTIMVASILLLALWEQRRQLRMVYQQLQKIGSLLLLFKGRSFPKPIRSSKAILLERASVRMFCLQIGAIREHAKTFRLLESSLLMVRSFFKGI